MHNLTAHVQTEVLSTGIAVSGTSTDWTSSGLDMRGFEGVRFMASVYTTDTSGPNLHAEMAATSSFATAIDVYNSAAYLSTSFTTGQGSAILVSDVFRPQYRYVRAYLDRATTGALMDWAIAELYRPGLMPTSASTGRLVADETIVVGTSGSATG